MRTGGKFNVSESNKTKYRISVELKQLLSRSGNWRSFLVLYLVVCLPIDQNGGTIDEETVT